MLDTTPPGSAPPSPTNSDGGASTFMQDRKKAAEQVRANIEKFVEGLMSEEYTLAQMLNESFSLEMLELLFKRMTSRLRGILFSREKTLEFIRLALDASYPSHTRAMAAQFIVVGGAMNAIAVCDPGKPHNCVEFWDSIFDTLQREADGVSLRCDTPLRRKERQASVAEMEELIQVAVKVFEKDGAETLQQSFADHEEEAESDEVAQRRKSSARSSLGADADMQYLMHSPLPSPKTPVNGEHALTDDTNVVFRDSVENSAARVDNDGDTDSEPDDTDIPAPLTTEVNETAMYGIFSQDSANFASQILRYFAIRGQKGACILHFLADHPATVDMLLANVGHDDIRTLLLHLIYAEHSEASITSLFETHMMQKLIQKQVTFSPPRNAFERDCIENTFILLRDIVHAPYLTGRGVAISARTIPLDKVTGQDEYVSICGASRETANSALRKYTSRKVRRLIHLFMQEHQAALELLFVQMIKELTFWSTPLTRERRGSAASLESLMLLSQGHPRPTCTMLLMHLFELTETVEFTDSASRNNGAGSNSAASVGIDCLNFLCSTHLMRKGNLLVKKKLKNELQTCLVSLNCMMGLRMIALREDQQGASSSLDQAFTPNRGNQTVITLDEMDTVQSSDWHEFGFSVTVKKKMPDGNNMPATNHQAVTPVNAMVHHQRRHGRDDNETEGTEVKSIEYFAASSETEKQAWITLLQAVIDGDLNELEIFCSDDWRSNVREYRRLRECLITCMERKGHELMVFLKQVITFHTRRASGFHLWSVVKCLNSVLSNESKRLDRMFVDAHVIVTLITCYEKYPMWNLLLGEITKMIVFCIGDFKGKRSRKCPIIGRILRSEGSDAKLVPLLCKVYLDRDTISNDGEREYDSMVGTDAMSNLKLIMEALKMCYKDPKTRSQERIQSVLKADPVWQRLLQASEEMARKNPLSCILAVGTPPALSPADVSNSTTPPFGASAPTPPIFQEHIINQISRPSYSTAHGFGSSFLEGDGCAFGYLFKERHGREWKKALVVYEYESHKLWYFYPSEVDETHTIQWKWIIPLSVRSRYTHGQDETHTSVGHHGLYITAYDHQQSDVDVKAPAKEIHFSVTKLEDRDLWKELLLNAASTIQQLCREYSLMAQKLKKPDKKTVTHCQDTSCNTPFKLFRRPHSCKRCGKWMCAKCTSQRMSIPEVGLLHPVRHCRACFALHGGAQAEVEPCNLFRPVDHKPSSSNGASANARGATAQNGKLANAELYELAHGMVSPRTLMQMNRRLTRLSSIDSPTGGEEGVGFHVDEINAPGSFGVENAQDEDDEYFPSSVSRRSLLNPREDIRGDLTGASPFRNDRQGEHMTPTKRTHDEVAAQSCDANGSEHERAKRSRRSRWGNDEVAAAKPTTASPKALSDIVKKLSSVVKEKTTPEELQAMASVASRPLIGVGGQLDAQAARARALAQASLMSLNLPSVKVSPNDLARRLYIGNLYYDLKEEDIRTTFAPFGAIHSIDLSLEPGASRSKGFCFLEYDDVLAAESAVQVLNGTPLANRIMRVGRPHRGNTNPNDSLSIGQEAIKNVPTKCIYISNVRVELNSQHLESIFSPFGVIRSCVMTAVSPLESGVHRGYGFMEFTEESFAQSAIQHMNGFELAGQPLKVGKASEAAMLINLATSQDKVVREGPSAEAVGHSSAIQTQKTTASFEEDDVEGVKDVADSDADEKCCLCLLNLVNRGDVDDELEGEVLEECSKFGSVKKVEIKELEDHVRIFALFGNATAAAKAKQALHGRFFGGNQVQAHYYPLKELEQQRYSSSFL
ncbi:hypothetical protein PHYBOEH_006960 [Phytophthora boehmeriae]|uniref:Uncharacterized protein n=1 Tax=Phytophthora boehmeriae TaxID=109152 RepID=A0A8T1WEJ6_9STRA|nr:hypothetical protein PHYBOEH_006960 [Phytophthora boehmeriae]